MWEEFYKNGIAAIGWDDLGDLTKFKDKEEIRLKLQELWPRDSSQKNNAHACWQFAHDITVGDIIFAKQGASKLFGYGVVESGYHFDDSRSNYQHTHKVKWHSKGEWEMPEGGKMALKTLTDFTRWPDFVKDIGDRNNSRQIINRAAPEPLRKSCAVITFMMLRDDHFDFIGDSLLRFN